MVTIGYLLQWDRLLLGFTTLHLFRFQSQVPKSAMLATRSSQHPIQVVQGVGNEPRPRNEAHCLASENIETTWVNAEGEAAG